MVYRIVITVLAICVGSYVFLTWETEWNFSHTTSNVCKLSGEQKGIRLVFAQSIDENMTSVSMHQPYKLTELVYSELQWSNLKTVKPTCQKFPFIAYSDNAPNGIGQGTLWLAYNGKALKSCKSNLVPDSGLIMAAILRQDQNLQIFDRNDERIASFEIDEKSINMFNKFFDCIGK